MVGLVTLGIGFTIIVNVCAVPEQVKLAFVYFGVTVIVEVIAALVVFAATNDPIFPVPEAANPIAVLLLLQSYVVPDTAEPDSMIVVEELPLHNVTLAGSVTVGVGFTVIVNVRGVPEQLCPPLE